MSRRILAALLACASASGPVSVAQAHVIAGVRVFPLTLTFDDPGTADEATLPQLVFQPGPDGQAATALQWEYDKTITPTTALIYNQGYDVLQQPGARTRTGLPSTLTIAPGVIYMADGFQAGLEALIPGNRATSPHVGAIAQLHVFLDDLFPNSLGKPLFP